jgi:ribosome biogenesis GTPase
LSETTPHVFDDAPGGLGAYGWNPSVAARYRPYTDPHHVPARIVRVDRTTCRIMTPAGLERCRLASTAIQPVTGDWAVVGRAPDAAYTLIHVLPRSTAVVRANAAGSGEQTLAANIDTMFILHGLDRPHRVGRLERLAILSWEAGVEPVMVLTKIDLAGTPGAVIGVDEGIHEIGKTIPGVEIVPASAVTGDGTDRLARYLRQGQTVGLAGESGAGKSSLINHLAGNDLQATGRTRRGDHKGTHTTTARELVPIPGGAVLMDTPGLRSISMPSAQDGLARSYADLEEYASQCRFRDCAHRAEPGCAVQAAIADGRVAPERWTGYRKLQREMTHEAQRAVDRSRRAETRTARRRNRSGDEEW